MVARGIGVIRQAHAAQLAVLAVLRVALAALVPFALAQGPDAESEHHTTEVDFDDLGLILVTCFAIQGFQQFGFVDCDFLLQFFLRHGGFFVVVVDLAHCDSPFMCC